MGARRSVRAHDLTWVRRSGRASNIQLTPQSQLSTFHATNMRGGRAGKAGCPLGYHRVRLPIRRASRCVRAGTG